MTGKLGNEQSELSVEFILIALRVKCLSFRSKFALEIVCTKYQDPRSIISICSHAMGHGGVRVSTNLGN